jgi:hypothetical protein
MRTESLQGRPPRWWETFIATWTVARHAKKSLHAGVGDDPRVQRSRLRVHVQSFATVLDGEGFVAVVSSGRSPNGAIAVGFSIATTASPCADIPHGSNAPSDASAEISFRILSANTPGFALVALAVGPVVLCREVAFSVELTDLDCWGSWEGSLPESSSLGGDRTPLRGAFIDSGFPPGFKNSLRGTTLSTLSDCRNLAAVSSRRPGPFWSAAMAHSFVAANTQIGMLRGNQRTDEVHTALAHQFSGCLPSCCPCQRPG